MTNTKRQKHSEQSSSEKLIVGKSDNREYKFLTLPNGMEAILVRVPEGQSSKAAVSVAVNAGSMSEPDDFGGLAHFVEHCVFLGNKKYPNRNSLDKLLSKHNGYSNAHTELEYTAFYLEVNREGLSKALNIFAAAFDGPLFDVELSCAELEAVDSEFHEIITNDECRIEQLLCHIAHPDHPYKKFTWGNRGSLLPSTRSKEELVAKARDFYNTHYTPNRMKLAIVSSYSLDKMTKMVTEEFSSVRSTALITPISNPLMELGNLQNIITDLPKTVAIKPITDTHQVILMFPMRPIADTYREKPADYLAHLIGHEGEGSLIEVLRLQSLATDISAGVGSDGYSNNSGMSIFEIKLTLTEQGVAEYERIVSEFVFPYIEKMVISESVFSEMKSIGEFQFHYTSEDSSKEPIDTAEELSVALLETMRIDRSDILVFDHLYEKYDEKLIQNFSSFLKMDNCLVLIVSKNFQLGESVLKEPRFGIDYAIVNHDVMDTSCSHPFIIPPNPNVFVPSLADLEAIKMTTERSTDLSVVPTKTVVSENMRLYHFSLARSISSPKVDVRIRFNFEPHGNTLDGFLATQVWVGYVTDLLEAKLYTAKLVGYRVSLASTTVGLGHESTVGIELVVNGFYGKIFDVIEMLIDAFEFDGKRNWEKQRMDRVFETIERNFRNEEMHPATNQATNMRRNMISPNSFYRSRDKLDRLREEMVRNPTRTLPCSADVLIVGDWNDIFDRIRGKLDTIVFSASSGLPLETVRAIDTELVVSEPSLNPDEHTTVVVVYYQFSSEFSVEVAAIAEVVADLMSEPFFDSLRTEEQLGYSVRCGSRYTNGSVGFEFMVQSSNEAAEKLVIRIEKFINHFFDKEIKSMSEEEYADQLDALLESLVEPPTSLAAEAKELWSEITENRLMWDYHPRVCDAIRKEFTKNKKKVKKIIEDYFKVEKRIVVKVNGHVAKMDRK
jgi:nardilysin